MKSSLFIRTAIAILAANCVFTGPAAAADEIAPPEIVITEPADQAPPETGGLDPLPVPYELLIAELDSEPPLPDQALDGVETPEPPLPDEPIRVIYYSLGGDGFDPTVIRNFGLEEDPAAAAVERVMTKVIDQAADTAVQPLTPAPL